MEQVRVMGLTAGLARLCHRAVADEIGSGEAMDGVR